MNKYQGAAKEIADLVAEKNKKYGDSFAKTKVVLKLFYPDGVKPDQYGDLLALVRTLDKMFRIATDKDAFGENPWKDIMGYALLMVSSGTLHRNE